MSQTYHLIKNNTKTEAVNIASDSVVLLWQRKRLWKPDTSKNYRNTKKQPSVPQKIYVEIANNVWTTKYRIFWDPTDSLIKRTKL